MKALLGDEYDAFAASMDMPSVHALRVNAIKPTTVSFAAANPDLREAVPYGENGYILGGDEKWGNSAWHHAGVIYMQDAAAMATVCAAPMQKDWRVLDTCASPGGKTTQLAARVGQGGVVVANEYAADRVRALRQNVERLGCANVIITHLDTAVLADTYRDTFDLVLCDAPCSGEGMFRKYPQAVTEWSPENVAMCAERQKEILKNAVACVRPGGFLLYSTCTFSVEENEENVAWLLDTFHLELCALPADLQAISRPGVTVSGKDLSATRRFYPHTAPGEGQFVALLHKAGEASAAERGGKKKQPVKSAGLTEPGRNEIAAVNAYFGENLTALPQGKLWLCGDTLCLSPDFPLPPYGVVLPGVAVGTVRKDRLEPHHHLFSAYGALFHNQLELAPDAPEMAAYLRGEEIPCAPSLSGWGVLCLYGAPVGGIKASNGRAKNHYPKGLRLL